MTQPHIIGPGAKARAVTDQLINELLTVLLEELGNGASRDQAMDLVGVELNEPRVDLARMRLLAASAVSRLAQMHHAVEQLADQWQGRLQRLDTLLRRAQNDQDDLACERFSAAAEVRHACVAELRTLVDDHG